MNSPEKVFGALLHKLRKERGLSQQLLASHTSLDRSYVSLLERGLRQPSLTSLLEISKALGVKASEMVRILEWLLDDDTKSRSSALANISAP